MSQLENSDPRAPRPLFGRAGSGPFPPNAGQVRTIPLYDVPEAAAGEDLPTMPMPGAEGATQPFIPFRPVQAVPAPGVPASARELGPVAGWLVIVSGPGRGRSLEVGFGRNAIGRSQANEVPVAFGDPGISDRGHAYVVYDSVGHKSYVMDGVSRNLVYLNGNPVFGSQELHSGDMIRLADTAFMFVAFCGNGIDWRNFPETLH